MHTHAETTTGQVTHKAQPKHHNPLGVTGIDHLEFFVDDVDAWADYYENKFGMYRRGYGDLKTGLKGRRAIVVGQGRVNFLFAQAEGKSAEADAIREFVAKHGNGVKDIAFRVKNSEVALKHAEASGCRVVRPLDEHDVFIGASIAAYGDTTHTFIQRKKHGTFAPGYVNDAGGIEDGDIQFAMIDHIVANVEHMDEWVDFYGRVFGFDQTAHFDINTGRSALMSKVVGDDNGYIKLPINEPSSKNSQIQEFLDEFKGPGVQHIALLTPNIITTVRAMREQGCSFMDVPDSYYDENFVKRVGEIKEDIAELKELKILVDRDRPDGYLLQLFTHPIFNRPTLFHEVIQRRGNSDGFGEGNFRALFEAIEREQARRGTL
ncbi:MAG TPA: 4-hydroxyphenylpyruvate dioxygenase [Planctomycetota bacterium]|nr:4-hydroxyphenylpyruvate dioxygenase [Planctomycetota bacterium]